MTTVDNRQFNSFNLLKGFLPVLVVALHTSSFSEPVCCFQSAETFLRTLIYKLGEAAVPVFFVISGYLFFINLTDGRYWLKKVKKRCRTLLLPYLSWITIAFFATSIWAWLKGDIENINLYGIKEHFIDAGGLRMYFDRPVRGTEYSILGTAVSNDQPLVVPLWYVRDLFILCILAPVIGWCCRKAGKIWLAAVTVIYILNLGLPFAGISVTGLLFFSTGAYFSVNGKSAVDTLHKFRLVSYIASTLLLIVAFIFEIHPAGFLFSIVNKLFIISFSVALFNIAADLTSKGISSPKLLVDSSFFTYSIHLVVVADLANFLLWRALPISSEWMLVLKVFLRPALTVGICLLIFIIMRKFLPKTLAVLTGGRS